MARVSYGVTTHGFQVVRRVAPVTAQMVADRLDEIREHFATWESVDDHPATGDRVAIEYQTAPEGETVGELVAEYFTISGGRTTTGFEAMLGTMRVGERVEGRLALGDDFHHPESRGTVRQVVVVLHKVERKILPAIDAAFAVARGFADVGELLAGVRRALETAMAREADRVARWALLTAFTEANPHVTPIDDEDLARSLDEAIVRGHQFTTADAWAEGERNARVYLRLGALLDLMVEHEGLTTTRADLRFAAKESARQSQPRPKPSALLAEWQKRPGQIAAISRSIGHRKAIKALERGNPYVTEHDTESAPATRPLSLVTA